MENMIGSSNVRNASYNGKHSFLPPKIPFSVASPSYADYLPNSLIAPKGFANPIPKDINPHHQRTSSESVLLEEQPSWLEELLNEPDTPVRKGGHRRSSSDSFAYIDLSNVSMSDHRAQHEYKQKNMISAPSWGSQNCERHRDVHSSFYPDGNSNLKNWALDPSLGHSARDNVAIQSPGSSSDSQEVDVVSSTSSQKKDSKSNFEWKDPSNVKTSASDSDTKRAKQQFAQRSRVRKLQYIAELENNVQALQAEGSEISAELDFVNQQNLILNMENKTLKQRLDSITQEQLIKYMEHEMLEREVGRLRTVGQQHQLQQQQPSSSSHRRTNSRDLDSQDKRINSKDLDSQFSNLSLKQHKDVGWGSLNS